MSATLDAGRVAAFLGGCPVVAVPGRTHPLTIEYAPGLPVGAAVGGLLARTSGNVLCFLPGAPEIRRVLPEVRAAAPGADVVELHGSLDADAQDAALRPAGGRRVILATNIAETSLTVPGVSGRRRHRPAEAAALRRRARLRPPAARAHHAGLGRPARGPCRAAGAGPRGAALGPARPPASASRAGHRADRSRRAGARRAGLGRRPRVRSSGSRRRRLRCSRLRWRCSVGCGALDDGRLTSLGERLRGLPLHPRLGAVLVAGGGAVEAARSLCAAGRRPARASGRWAPRRPATSCRPSTRGRNRRRPSGRRPTSCRVSPASGQTRIDASTSTKPSCAARSWPATPTASPGDARPARRACCWRRAPAPNWPATAASAMPNGWSRSTWPARSPGATPGCLPPVPSSVSGWNRRRPRVEHTLTDQGRVRATRVTWYDALRLAEAPVDAGSGGRRRRCSAEAYLVAAARRGHNAAAAAAPLHRRRRRPAGAGRRRPQPARGPSTTSTSARICPGTVRIAPGPRSAGTS